MSRNSLRGSRLLVVVLPASCKCSCLGFLLLLLLLLLLVLFDCWEGALPAVALVSGGVTWAGYRACVRIIPSPKNGICRTMR